MKPRSPQKYPVLLLHGICGTAETLRPLTAALSACGFDVTCPTLAEAARRRVRFGDSLAHVGLDALLDEARENAARLCAEGAKPMILGHSNGALLALALAGEGLASRLGLLAPVPPPSIGSGVPKWLQGTIFRARFGRQWQTSAIDLRRRHPLDPDPAPAGVGRTLLPDSRRALAEAIALKAGGAFDPDPALEIGVTVIAGQKDRVVPNSRAKRVAARFNADFRLLEGAGHWFPAETRFAETIADLFDLTAGSAPIQEGAMQ